MTTKRTLKVRGTLFISHLNLADKLTRQASIKASCTTSTDYLASKPCQDAMAAWDAAATTIETKQTKLSGLLSQVAAIRAELVNDEATFDDAGADFLVAAQPVIKAKPTAAGGMGIKLIEPGAVVDTVEIPGGAKIHVTRKNVPFFQCDNVLGAKLYRAMWSATPAVESSWQILVGKGRRRALDALPAGVACGLRWCAISHTDVASGWTETVTFTRK